MPIQTLTPGQLTERLAALTAQVNANQLATASQLATIAADVDALRGEIAALQDSPTAAQLAALVAAARDIARDTEKMAWGPGEGGKRPALPPA